MILVWIICVICLIALLLVLGLKDYDTKPKTTSKVTVDVGKTTLTAYLKNGEVHVKTVHGYQFFGGVYYSTRVVEDILRSGNVVWFGNSAIPHSSIEKYVIDTVKQVVSYKDP